MTSISETLFDTYGDSLMQEYAPYDEAEILAALDRMSMPQDMQIQVCDLLSSCYLRWAAGKLVNITFFISRKVNKFKHFRDAAFDFILRQL